MTRIREKGCIASRLDGRGFVPCEIHHLTVGGRHGQLRRGHMATIGLSPWHHRGVCRPGWSIEDMTAAYGPSYAHQPTAFRDHYGDDERLLQYQDEILML
jgi:hypothetical protein